MHQSLAESQSYISPVIAELSETGNQLCESSISDMVKNRDRDALALQEIVATVAEHKAALGVVFDAFFVQRYPNHVAGQVEESMSMIANRNGFLAAKADLTGKEWDESEMISLIDAKHWQRLIETSDVDACMSGKQKEQWRISLESGDVPTFDIETVQATLKEWGALRAQAFIDRVESVWEAMSDEHVSNSRSHFERRFILSERTSPVEVLNELRAVISIIEGKEPIPREKMGNNQLIKDIEMTRQYGAWQWVDGNALAIRYYKKGTLHVAINAVAAAKMNDVLAMRYANAIPGPARNVKRASTKSRSAPLLKREDCLTYQQTEALDQIVRAHHIDILRALRQLGVQDGGYLFNTSNDLRDTFVNDVMSWLGAEAIYQDGKLLCWRSDYDIWCVLAEIRLRGALPNIKSHQFYPSKGNIGERAAEVFWSHVEDAGDKRYCEPHGGHGDLAAYLPQERTTVVELSPVNAALLKAKGFDVHCGDFLPFAERHYGQYDGILMNPPFEDGQAYLHTDEAIRCLVPGGVLVAIIPGSARAKIEDKWRELATVTHSETIIGAFEGVNVAVEIVTVIMNEG